VPRLSFSDVRARESQLALHPGSGSERKNWPEDKWAALLAHITDHTNVSLLLVGGEAEGDRLQRLAFPLPPQRVRVAQSLPLPELGRMLERCAGFVGHDSGVSHLAAALSVPALLLWGNSPPEIWKPPGERVTIITSPDGLDKLAVTDVIQALQHLNLPN